MVPLAHVNQLQGDTAYIKFDPLAITQAVEEKA